MREETQQSIALAAVNGEKYDESCKAVFHNQEIMAPILKYVVEEFKDCTLEEIIRRGKESTDEDIFQYLKCPLLLDKINV